MRDLETGTEIQWSYPALYYKASILGSGGGGLERTIPNPFSATVHTFLAFYNGIEKSNDRALMRTFERKMSWSDTYTSSHDELGLELFLRTLFSPHTPLRTWFTIDFEKNERKQKHVLAKIQHGSNLKKDIIKISEPCILHENIGAVKGFLEMEIDARYQLTHTIPKEVYDFLEELARFRGE